MCAVLDEENQLTPRSDSISTWEKFKIYKINDSEYGIRSAENRKYVKADLDNGCLLYTSIFATSNNKIFVAILSFGINSGAYVAEIFRGRCV